MRVEILLLIAGMGIVTYIPRMLPTILLDKIHIGKRMEKFLKLIPFTAMAALIFHGILSVDAGHAYVGMIGGVAAAFFAWRKLPIAVTIAGSVMIVMLVYL